MTTQLRSAGATRRLAAILVVGNSHPVERDDQQALSAMQFIRAQILQPLVASHQGRIIKRTADGVLVEFASVVDAVNCAIAIQERVARDQGKAQPGRRIAFRMGVNLGDVAVDGDNVLGDGVTIAARLEQLSEPGSILVSGTAYDQLHGKVGIGIDLVGEQEVHGTGRKMRIYRVGLGGSAAAHVRSARPLFYPALAACALVLLIAIGLAVWVLLPESGPPAGTDALASSAPAGAVDAPPLIAAQPESNAIETASSAPPLVPAWELEPAQALGELPAPSPSAETDLTSQPPLEPAPADLPRQTEEAVAVAARMPAPADRATELKSYIERFDGGACFFAHSQRVSDRSAAIQAYAVSMLAAQRLDEAFRHDNGFEPRIDFARVTEAQCPVVDFLRKNRGDEDLAPVLILESYKVGVHEPLVLALKGRAGRHLALLLVTDTGQVELLQNAVLQTDRIDFAPARLTYGDAVTAKTQLLVAAVGDRPLDLPPVQGRSAAEYFPLIEASMGNGHVGIAARYFILGGA